MRPRHVLLCALMVSVPAFAQETQPPAGFHEHDGFFLSLSMGPAYASVDNTAGSTTLTYSGFGASFDFRIGGAIGQNLILTGDLMGWSLFEPEVSGHGSMSDSYFTQSTVGAGLTYYFMPVNVFVSGTVGFAGFSLDASGRRASTDSGVGVYVKAGKDWWVSADWALGIAASLGWSSVSNSTDAGSEKLSGYSVSLQFNATYQ